MTREGVAAELTNVYKEEIKARLKAKYKSMGDDKIKEKVLKEFYKEAGDKKDEFTHEDVSNDLRAMKRDQKRANKVS